MRLVLAIACLVLATAAHGQNSVTCNAHGAVVTLADGTTYYLGNDCDAVRKGGGTGRWFLAASAFVVEVNGTLVRLPIEVDCPLPACWSS
jgi:hypothetical protein